MAKCARSHLSRAGSLDVLIMTLSALVRNQNTFAWMRTEHIGRNTGVSEMEFKLNLVIKINSCSEQNARHRRDMIYAAIRQCAGVEEIEESWFTVASPVFEEVEE